MFIGFLGDDYHEEMEERKNRWEDVEEDEKEDGDK